MDILDFYQLVGIGMGCSLECSLMGLTVECPLMGLLYRGAPDSLADGAGAVENSVEIYDNWVDLSAMGACNLFQTFSVGTLHALPSLAMSSSFSVSCCLDFLCHYVQGGQQ
jgi:hypothetical protein